MMSAVGPISETISSMGLYAIGDSSSVSPTTQEDQIPSISAAYSSIES